MVEFYVTPGDQPEQLTTNFLLLRQLQRRGFILGVEPVFGDVMADNDEIKNNFLYPRSKFWGEFTPQNLAFNANLQEFAQRISVICNLETGGKLSADEAYQEIKALWKELKQSKKNLIDAEPPTLDEGDGNLPED